MPAWLLAQVTTYWRVYSRIGLLAELAPRSSRRWR